MQQKKPFFAYALEAGVAGMLVVAATAPVTARQVQKTMTSASYQVQSAASSYAFAPQIVSARSRYGQCWIATDASRPYGYVDTCANPLAHDPALDPSYNSTLQGD